ncbi:MAG: entericidin A/B family lipoprotein [Spongiibacteraceae bacterium]|jgi:predicted small secreted protein|nr:entericidin A/B family lipoprotein [Spongiibacteraceae bacterium]
MKQCGKVVLVLALAILASGCNTMRGVGQDIEAAGQAIQNTARR